ncbi:MAG: immunoglobulin domain-containing protein [Phycisphaeraceae bacterium]|nr:immunoglobulin domain-containing protein [Phycisphaeraceae bacterium]MCW5754825.1 immunoglobulin domain-containing protein [Phycisphaeraceae bacterium]
MAGLAGAEPVQWQGNGHWYEVIVVPDVNWGTARDAAVLRGGYLATITSQEENDFVFQLVMNTPNSWYYFDDRRSIGPWLGGYQTPGSKAPDEGWVWVTGEPFEFTNWAPGQPDNDDLGECFLHFSNLGPVLDGTWNDRAANDNNRDTAYVVEYDSVPCPRMLLQPTSKRLCPGQRAVFTARAFSPFPLTYQWYKDGQPLVATERVRGVATSRLVIENASDADEGLYECMISNICGTMFADPARLTVGVPGDLTGSSNPLHPAYGIPDGKTDFDDFIYFLHHFEAQNGAVADLTGSSDVNDPAYGAPDGRIDMEDFFYFLDRMVQGCPPPPNEGLGDDADPKGTPQTTTESPPPAPKANPAPETKPAPEAAPAESRPNWRVNRPTPRRPAQGRNDRP